MQEHVIEKYFTVISQGIKEGGMLETNLHFSIINRHRKIKIEGNS